MTPRPVGQRRNRARRHSPSQDTQGRRASRRRSSRPRGGLEIVDYLAGASLAAAGLLVGARPGGAASSSGTGRSATASSGRATTPPRPRWRSGSAPTPRAPGSSTSASGCSAPSWPRRTAPRRPSTPPTCRRAPSTCGSTRRTATRPRPGRPRTAARCGGWPRTRAACWRSSPAARPYPGLVSIGTDASGRVLVDLEAAQGLINIRGPQTTAALAALAVELATNRWSDRMRITLVGFGEELTAIAPDRIRAVGSLAEVLPELEATAAPAPGGAHRPDHRPARATPHYLLSAVAPTHEEARRLALLARKRHRRIRGDGRRAARHLDPGDHRGRPGEDRGAGLRGDRAAAAPPPLPGTDRPVPYGRAARRRGAPRGGAAGGPGTTRGGGAGCSARSRSSAATPMEEGRMALATELLVYLATHPGGVHPVVSNTELNQVRRT